MSRFLCSVYTQKRTPAAVALFEHEPATATTRRRYILRDLRLVERDGVQEVADLLASEPQYVGQTTLVVLGGQPAADLFADRGLSAIAVRLVGGTGKAGEALETSPAGLRDTFEHVFRDGDVQVQTAQDLAADAVRALYPSADLEAAAAEPSVGSEAASGEEITGEAQDDPGLITTMAGTTLPDGPGTEAVVEQSGSAANEGTAVVGSGTNAAGMALANAAAADAAESRVAPSSGAEAVDLGEHQAAALAMALGVWYGEAAGNGPLATDKADE